MSRVRSPTTGTADSSGATTFTYTCTNGGYPNPPSFACQQLCSAYTCPQGTQHSKSASANAVCSGDDNCKSVCCDLGEVIPVAPGTCDSAGVKCPAGSSLASDVACASAATNNCNPQTCCRPLTCAGAVATGAMPSCAQGQLFNATLACTANSPCNVATCCADTCQSAGIRCPSGRSLLATQRCSRTAPASSPSACSATLCCRQQSQQCEAGAGSQRPYTCMQVGKVFVGMRLVNGAIQCTSSSAKNCMFFTTMAACQARDTQVACRPSLDSTYICTAAQLNSCGNPCVVGMQRLGGAAGAARVKNVCYTPVPNCGGKGTTYHVRVSTDGLIDCSCMYTLRQHPRE